MILTPESGFAAAKKDANSSAANRPKITVLLFLGLKNSSKTIHIKYIFLVYKTNDLPEE